MEYGALKIEISSHSLTDHSRKHKANTKKYIAIILHNTKLIGGMCLLGFRRV